MNPSRVLRQEHPYVVWSGNEFSDKYQTSTVTVIPLTSSENQMGLPTTYPIKPTTQNGLHKHSYALVNQIITIDVNCLRENDGKWKERIGQLTKKDKNKINERLKYYFSISDEITDDWFMNHSSIELLKKVYQYLQNDEKDIALEELLDL